MKLIITTILAVLLSGPVMADLDTLKDHKHSQVNNDCFDSTRTVDMSKNERTKYACDLDGFDKWLNDNRTTGEQNEKND